MAGPAPRRPTGRPIDRSAERRIVVAGILLAAGFLVAAAASLSLPATTTRGIWLPLHLALAGAATTAIAAVMPFFAAAFAAAPPADARLRAASIAAVAAGAAIVAAGVAAPTNGVAVAGGATFLAGVAGIAAATAAPLRGALGPGRGLVTRAYLVALGQLGVGVLLGSLFLAGWEPMVGAWIGGRSAHAWLNLVGFVSLVIATTLLHFFPTVAGARIGGGLSPRIAVYGLAVGPPLVAAGSLVASDVVVRAGALTVGTGAAGLTVYAVSAWRRRSRWTTDHGWHRFAMVGLAGAIAWFDIGIAIAAGRVLILGAAPAAWSTALVVGPLVVGWVATTIVASATHLLPAVGPGGPADHARQRRLLGSVAVSRLVTLNGGVAALTVGTALDVAWIRFGGAIAIASALAVSVGLLAGAVVLGARRWPVAH